MLDVNFLLATEVDGSAGTIVGAGREKRCERRGGVDGDVEGTCREEPKWNKLTIER